ncbi:MAG TPA: sigma-54 dependent transcriptional regulator [Blastocatellia bacterium]|nr:sigma-54 dependent transcriptional regulator [Blastocatellia bacterium]
MNALVIDDEPLIRENMAEILRADGWAVSEAESAERALSLLQSGRWNLVFCDIRLGAEDNRDGLIVLERFIKEQPEARIIVMTGHGSAAGALDAVSSGAYDYLMKPFDIERVMEISQAVRLSLERQANPASASETKSSPVYTSETDLVGRSAAFVEMMKLVGRVAATSLPVLITGASGTGKEVVARAIHRRSLRSDNPFVAVNCGALPSELIESELFGHVRGSFTGATSDRRGLWEEADGGTVFLDEVTETTPAFQVKLLRALQEGEIRRVGSNSTIRVDVRVIAATNRDVEPAVREGHFRQDLLYRLNAVTLRLPPLHERREDVLPLARHFARRVTRPGGTPPDFSPEAIELLEQYSWPGNIRELENAIMRAAALCDHMIRPEDLPERIRSSSQIDAQVAGRTVPAQTRSADQELITLAELEARHITRVLAHTGGNKQAAARILGIDRTTLQRMIKRYGIDSDSTPDSSAASGSSV